MPISEIAQCYTFFAESSFYQKMLVWQAYLFDFCDFFVALIILYLFFKSGLSKKEDKIGVLNKATPFVQASV